MNKMTSMTLAALVMASAYATAKVTDSTHAAGPPVRS
jgi:hypothetical protein